MHQQRFLERRQYVSHATRVALEQVHLSLKLSLDLLQRETLCPKLTHSPQHRQRLKVILRIVGRRSARRLYDALLGPTANHSLAQSEQLLYFSSRVERFYPLIVGLWLRPARELEYLAVFFGHRLGLDKTAAGLLGTRLKLSFVFAPSLAAPLLLRPLPPAWICRSP